MSRITIRDVAKAAGVSLQTVSNVLNNRGDQMSSSTLARVQQAIADLNYHRNPAARGLRAAKADCLGFMILDEATRFLADPMTDLFLAGFGDFLRENEYSLLIQASRPSWALEKLLLPLETGRVDSAVLLLSGDSHRRHQLMSELSSLDRPLLLLQEHNADDYDLSSLVADDRAASRALCEHLLSRGRTRVAYLTSAHRWSAIEERFAGYMDAHREAGVTPDSRLVVWEGGFNALDAAAAAHRLLDYSPPPDAIMCGNDLIALGVLKAARERGHRIPDDLAVTGFDDFEFAAAVDPPLTTVRIPGYEMGERAALLLTGTSSSDDSAPQKALFPATIQFRDSA